MFRSHGWDAFRDDIIAFCQLIGNTPWHISQQSYTFLKAVQRGYARASLTGAPDHYRAMAAVSLWNACCHPERLQLLMAGSEKFGKSWVQYLKTLCGDSTRQLRENVLFTEDDCMMMVPTSDEPVLFVLSPGHLVGVSQITGGRPTVLIMPDLNRVATETLPMLQSFVKESGDQWIAGLPAGK